MTDFLPRPELAPPGVWSFPTPSRTRLDNGLETVVFQLPGQHVVSAHLVLDIPLNAEDRSIEGVATMCARVLDEGSRQHDGEEFAELLETEGAGFGIEVALAGLQAILDVPVSHLDRALELFAEAVREPSLSERDVTGTCNCDWPRSSRPRPIRRRRRTSRSGRRSTTPRSGRRG